MILFPVSREAYLPFLVCSFVLGILLGAFYEPFRIRRRLFCGGGDLFTVITALEDVIFFVAAAVVMILACYKLNYGVPRWYAYVGAALGFAAWRKTAGRLVFPVTDGLKKALAPIFAHLKVTLDRRKEMLRLKVAEKDTRLREKILLDVIFKEEK